MADRAGSVRTVPRTSATFLRACLEATDTAAGTLLLAAHYDSVPTGPGASDDAAGVAGLLETARALLSQQKTAHLRNDIVFLFTDGEEAGLFGARAFVKPRGEVIALNFEARGTRGPALMFETGPQNGGLVRRFARAAPQPTASSLFYAVYKILPNDTDFTEFRSAGMRGLNFAFIDRVGDYHAALDNVSRLDARSLQQQGDNMLGLARDLGNAPLEALAQPDAIYFNITRAHLAVYPETWAIPLAVCATLLTLIFLAAGLRTRQITPRSVVGGLLQILAALVLAIGGGALPVRLLAATAPSPRSVLYLGGSVPVGISLFVSGLTLALFLRCAPRKKALWSLLQNADKATDMPQSVLAGAILWWLPLTWLTALKLPGGSYLFAWPLLFVLTANLATRMRTLNLSFPETAAQEAERKAEQCQAFAARKDTSAPAPIIPVVPDRVFLALMISAIPALLLIVPVLFLLFSALAVTALPVIALLVALTVSLLFPQFVLMTRLMPRYPLLPPLLAALGGAMLVGAGTLAIRPTAARPQSDGLFYALNADTGRAIWGSDDLRPDIWTRQFLGDKPARSALPDFLPVSAAAFLHSSAPSLPLAPPIVTLLAPPDDSRKRSGSGKPAGRHNTTRALRVHVFSPRHAPLVEVAVRGNEVVEAAVEGQAVGGNTGTGHDWSLMYFNLPPEGITLRLRIKTVSPESPVTVHAIDRSYGIPPFPTGSYAPRPDFMISSPAAGWYQDTALVSKIYRF